jgi:small subunit ribosomal protein S17
MARTEKATHLRTLKKIVGVVVSTGMDRTAVVAVTRLRLHPKIRRFVRVITKYFCHDRHEICGVGDKVQLKACQQLSKKKHWTIVDMIERHPQLEGEPFPMSRLRLPLEEYARLRDAAAAGSQAGAPPARGASDELR